VDRQGAQPATARRRVKGLYGKAEKNFKWQMAKINGKWNFAICLLPFEFPLLWSLPHPQLIYSLERRSAFTTNDCATVAAYERLLNPLAT
jgi:hypothetical protein